MKPILVLCDDYWHPAEIVEKGLSPLSGDKYSFEFVKDAKDILTPKMLWKYPLIINCKGNHINAANQNPWFEEGVTEVMTPEFQSYVESGGGFLVLHSGNTFHGEETAVQNYTEFVGNRFVTHPPRCTVTLRKTKVHPITTGVADAFSIRDEHYQIELLAPDADVFLSSVSEAGGTQTAGYTRTPGEGRLCVLTPGHILSVWQHPQFRRLLENAIAWCLKEDASL